MLPMVMPADCEAFIARLTHAELAYEGMGERRLAFEVIGPAH